MTLPDFESAIASMHEQVRRPEPLPTMWIPQWAVDRFGWEAIMQEAGESFPGVTLIMPPKEWRNLQRPANPKPKPYRMGGLSKQQKRHRDATR